MPGGIFDNDFMFGRADAGVKATTPAIPYNVLYFMDAYGMSQGEAETLARATAYGEAGLPRPGGGGGGGGGGSAYVDHFFDVNPLDQAMFDWKQGIDSAYLDIAKGQYGLEQGADARAQAMFEHEQAMDDRDFALAIGDFGLAQQKQADANYWQGISAGLEQQRLNLTNQGQQLDYAARMEGVAAQREASNQQYQANMASAQNDRDRIRAENVWRQEQAQIARMEDETRRILGGQQNQTAQFGAETQRAGLLGQLALDTNKFIMESATNPRNLPALFMMQRGVAPDWDTLAAGGTPAQGQALRPYDPMKAYIPTTAAPTFNGTPQNSQAAKVGSFLGGFNLGDNPFINLSQLSSGGGGGGAAANVSFVPYGNAAPPSGPPSTQAPPISIDYDINPGGRQGGVPLAALKPGMNLSTVGGGDRLGSSFTVPAYYDKGKTRPIGANDVVSGGTQVWIDYTPEPARYAAGSRGKGRGGGFVNDAVFMSGDAPSKNPNAGGARPEIIENPTRAPLRINSNPRTQDEMRRKMAPAVNRANTSAYGSSLAKMRNAMQQQSALPAGFEAQPRRVAPQQNDLASRVQAMQEILRGRMAQGPMQPIPGAPMLTMDDTPGYQAVWGTNPYRGASNAQRASLLGAIRRFALGSNSAQSAYADMGMSGYWVPTSSNPGLAGMELPDRLQMLADVGFPVPPSTAAAATGTLAPQLNFGRAINEGRGLGVAPSLQSLTRMGKGEQEAARGYYEGVGGTPWADLVDWIARPTSFLGKAATSRGV